MYILSVCRENINSNKDPPTRDVRGLVGKVSKDDLHTAQPCKANVFEKPAYIILGRVNMYFTILLNI
jgi:hypothetical protein